MKPYPGNASSHARATALLAMGILTLLVLASANAAAPPISLVGTHSTLPGAISSVPEGAHPLVPSSSSGWVDLTSNYSTAPAARAYGDMAYDAASGYYVLFGGENGAGVDGDTWNFTVAHGWKELSSSSSVAARADAAIAYDSTDKEVVLFGGCEGLTNCPPDDTWIFSGGSWTQMTKGSAPTGTLSATLSDDPAESGALMFGGCSSFTVSLTNSVCNTFIDSTYLFKAGAGWSQVSSTKSPSDRDSSLMAYDPVGGYVLLFGGYTGSASLGDTWTFKGGQWTNITSTLSTSPPARSSGVMFWDAAANEIIMFGGDGSSADIDDTWAFSNGQWTEISASGGPSARDGAMWGAPTTVGTPPILFGGETNGGASYLSDTWEFIAPLLASASATPSAVDVTQPVSFNAVASGGQGPYTYAWSFGDGNSSAQENTTHAYDTPKLPYLASLTVKDHAGNTVTRNFDVNVTALPHAGAQASPSVALEGQNVTFWANTTGGLGNLTYLWDFGDSHNSTLQDPTHAYQGPGKYTATVTVVDSTGAPSTASVNVSIKSPPGAMSTSFTASPPSGGVPLTVSFTSTVVNGTSPYTYLWNYSDNSSTSAAVDPSHTFNKSGSYTVRLSVTDHASHQASYSMTILVNPPPLKANATATPLRGLTPLNVSFQGSGSGGDPQYAYLWSFGGTGTSAAQDPTHTFNSSGLYNVSLRVEDSPPDAKTAYAWVEVNATASTPLAVSLTPPGCVVEGTATTFQANVTGSYPPFSLTWNFGDQSTPVQSNGTSESHTYAKNGTYVLNVTALDQKGSQAYSTLTINVETAAGCSQAPKATVTGLGVDQWMVMAIPLVVLAGVTVLILMRGRPPKEDVPAPPEWPRSPAGP